MMFQRPDETVPAVTAAEARALVDDGALLIDVREDDEWHEARIPGAEHRPMQRINEWYTDLPQNRTIVVQCRTGARSESVVKALTQQAGMTDVHNLSGGIVAWAQSGFAVES